MTPAKLTQAAIDKHIENSQESSHRCHLGASVIGKKCARELWYNFRWVLAIKHPAQLLRLFNRGQLEEARFVAYLRAIGCDVWEFDSKGKQWKISDHNGHLGGSLDAVGRKLPDLPKDLPFLCEFKTHGAKSFAKLIDLGVMGSKWEHFVQMQVYMRKKELTVALYMAVNKDTDEWHLEIIHLDVEVADNAIARAGTIIYSNEPPARIAESPGAFACKFCSYNRLCHFGDVAIDRNCRTCRFSRPGANAMWICGLHETQLDEKAQREGCRSYQIHNKLEGAQ